MDETHYIPINDSYVHVANSCCECMPIQDQDHPMLWVHQSFDGREKRLPISVFKNEFDIETED